MAIARHSIACARAAFVAALATLAALAPGAAVRAATVVHLPSRERVQATRPPIGASWLAPEATSGRDLLYLTDPKVAAIDVFSRADPTRWVGQLTDLFLPSRLFVDAQNDLWAANFYGSVWMFEPGHTKPSRIYSKGLLAAFAVVVGNDGTVYVMNETRSGRNEIVEYGPGATAPTRVIPLHESNVNLGFGGIALDASGTLYAAYPAVTGKDVEVRVVQIPFGSSTPRIVLRTTTLYDVQDIAFDPSGSLVVCSLSHVSVFHPGAQTPFHQFNGFDVPEEVAFGKNDIAGKPTTDVLMYVVDLWFDGFRLDYTERRHEGKFGAQKLLGPGSEYGIAVSADAQP